MATTNVELPTTALSVVLERAAKREQNRRERPQEPVATPLLSPEERFVERERLSQEVKSLMLSGEFAVALEKVDGAARQYKIESDREGQALTLHLQGGCLRRLNDLPAALEKHQASYALYEALNEPVLAANALLAKAGVLRILGKDEEALSLTRQCRDIYRQAGETAQEMRTLMNLSVMYKQLGDLATSQELLYECLPFFEQNGMTNDAAKVLLNIAVNYNVLKKPQEAIPFAVRGIALFEEKEDLHSLSMARCVLGTAYLKSDEYEAALEQLRIALELAERLNIRWTTSIVLGDIGTALMGLKRFDEARVMIERSVAINSSDENRGVYCDSIEQLGRLYAHPEFAGRDAQKALRYLQEARHIAEELGGNVLLVKVYKALAELQEQTGDFKQALEAYQAYHAVQQSIFNEESDKRIKELQTRFEVEKTQKDLEIAHLRTVELADALKEAERLRALADAHARTDTLTGVENRRALDERLVQEFARARRSGRPLTVALLDIDHFKKINDTFGHAVGDGALRHLTTVLRSQSRTGDYIARYGGEEFALLFPETGLAEAKEICERLRMWVAASAWSQVHPGMHQVTTSVGLALFAGDNRSIKAIFEEADQNLYKAKQGGRNQVVG